MEVIKAWEYRNIWFGYYDISPFRPSDASQVLMHGNNLAAHVSPAIRHSTDICLFNRRTGKLRKLDSTKAWNWQQGSRLQWLDDRHVIFNQYDGALHAVRLNVETGERTRMPSSVNIAYGNKYYLTLDYQKLTSFSEYGYPGMTDDTASDMIAMYDFESGQLTRLLDYLDIREAGSEGELLEGFHVNHLLPSMNGKGFVFIARGYREGRRNDFLCHFDIESRQLRRLISWQTISHYCWLSDYRLLFWGVMDGVAGYYTLDIAEGSAEFLAAMTDGPPNVVDEKLFITDIVDNWRDGDITLCLIDADTGARRDLLCVSHPQLLRKTNRCDMHVSLSPNKREFQIDSRHGGHRSMIIGQVPSAVELAS